MRKVVIAVIAAVIGVLLLGGKVIVDRLARTVPLRGELEVVQLAAMPGGAVAYRFQLRVRPSAHFFFEQSESGPGRSGGSGQSGWFGSAGLWNRLFPPTITNDLSSTFSPGYPLEAFRVEAGKKYPLVPGKPFVITDFSDDRKVRYRWVVGIAANGTDLGKMRDGR